MKRHLSYLLTAPGWALVAVAGVRAAVLCTFTTDDGFGATHYLALVILAAVMAVGWGLVAAGRWLRAVPA